jgi:hypothetical protein
MALVRQKLIVEKGHGDIATFQKMAVNQSVKTKWNREYKTPFSH